MPMISVPVEKGKPMDNITLKLNSPITEDQWDAITDVDFENTEEILFTTKHKKNVRFVKAQQWIPCSERWPEEFTVVLVSDGEKIGIAYRREYLWYHEEYLGDIAAWMPLPEPYKEEK